MKPSVGRIVHYVAYGTPKGEFPANVCRAAIVSQVVGEPGDAPIRCGVVVLNPTGLFFNVDIPQDEIAKAPGSWHWPERVE
jgi:hypothetical protein